MRVSVIGLGLIGGSLALGTRARGYDRDPSVRARARARGVDAAETLADAVRDADVVVAAVPPPALGPVLADVAQVVPTGVLTEVTSSKRGLDALGAVLPAGVRLVGSHPMAGSTRSGIAAADPTLFRDRPWLLVPGPRSDAAAMARVGELARSVGARPIVTSVDRHEELMTNVSRLPLVLAAALMRAAARFPEVQLEGAVGADFLALVAGPGFLDTTRLAGTPVDLALELVLADPDALAGAVDDLTRVLGPLAGALRARDQGALAEWLGAAAAARAQLDGARDESTPK